MSEIEIRGEDPGDEAAIDAVVCRAFRSMHEANLVRLLRAHAPGFDRRFSVTAWAGGEVVGHTLFNPAPIRLMGRAVGALAVGPVAVVPPWQRKGVGGRMLAFGHERGRSEGYALAFLNGHPSYYPQHGYQACFGFAKVTIDVDALPAPSQPLESWPVRGDDVGWLARRFAIEWADVDFSWQWGDSLDEWTLPGTDAVIWRTAAGRRAAYTLRALGRKDVKLLLADDADLARDVIATLRPESLEHHPSGWLARNAIDPAWGKAKATSSGAAMACALRPGALDEVVEAVQNGGRPPGTCNWPLPFVLC